MFCKSNNYKRYSFVPICLGQEDSTALIHETKVKHFLRIGKRGRIFSWCFKDFKDFKGSWGIKGFFRRVLNIIGERFG